MNKNKKGEGQISMLLAAIVTIIVGLVLFQAIAANVEQGTQTNTGASVKTNVTATKGPIGTVTILTGQELVGTPVIYNGSGVTNIASNWSVYECVRTTDGLKGICYKSTGINTPEVGETNGSVKVTYSYYPDGYIDDSGGRAITGIIILLTAIGIAMVFLPFFNKD